MNNDSKPGTAARRQFLADVKKDDQVFVPKFNQICRVKKFNRAEQRLTGKLSD